MSKANKSAAPRRSPNRPQPALEEFLYQLLETELGGVEVYRAALQSALDERLREEWTNYLRQTQEHVKHARRLLEAAGLDPEVDTPARQVCRTTACALVHTIELARGGDDPRMAEIVAAECVVHAETKDHANWSLVGRLANEVDGELARDLRAAHAAVEDEEDEHLYHTTGWARELWLQALGLEAQLPPPEETQDARSAVAAARARGAGDSGPADDE